MYKDKEKQKAKGRERIRRYREKGKGVTEPQGVTASEGQGVTDLPWDDEGVPDIIDKLTDSFWRPRLEKICHAFNASHHPDYAHDVTLGVYGQNFSIVCDLLECTR